MSAVVLQAERAFPAMGTDAHVLVWGGPACPIEPEDLLDVAEAEFRALGWQTSAPADHPFSDDYADLVSYLNIGF